MARSGEDILEHYGVKTNKENKIETPDLGEDAAKIFALFKTEDSVSFDDIVEKLEMKPQQVSVALTGLEMKGLIRKVSANEFSKNGD